MCQYILIIIFNFYLDSWTHACSYNETAIGVILKKTGILILVITKTIHQLQCYGAVYVLKFCIMRMVEHNWFRSIISLGLNVNVVLSCVYLQLNLLSNIITCIIVLCILFHIQVVRMFIFWYNKLSLCIR